MAGLGALICYMIFAHLEKKICAAGPPPSIPSPLRLTEHFCTNTLLYTVIYCILLVIPLINHVNIFFYIFLIGYSESVCGKKLMRDNVLSVLCTKIYCVLCVSVVQSNTIT